MMPGKLFSGGLVRPREPRPTVWTVAKGGSGRVLGNPHLRTSDGGLRLGNRLVAPEVPH
jgi:hypothetical protein